MAIVTATIAGISTVGVAVGSLFGATLVAGSAAALAVGAGSIVLGAAAINALAPKPKFSGLSANRGYRVTQTGSALDHQIIYGKTKVFGVRVFDYVADLADDPNEVLHRVIAFSGHEIDSFEEIYFNEEELTIDASDVEEPTRYEGNSKVFEKLGTSNQVPPSLLSALPVWTSNHKLNGIAYLYLNLEYDSDAFPNGVPEVSAVIKGKKVFDPRDSSTSWSDNPALCLRDYLTNEDYGLGASEDNIDDDMFIDAANVCDQTVSGQKRYTCNGAFTTGAAPYEVIEDLLTSMGGSLWYSQGKWRVKPAYWTSPVETFDEDDLRSTVSVITRNSRRDNFNTVRGTYKGSETNWVPTDYFRVRSNNAVSVDGGTESSIDIPLAFTDTEKEARRLARITLERNRQQLVVSASFGLKALKVQVGDNIRLNNSRFGWTNKEFEVISWSFGLGDDLDIITDLVLKETAEEVFDEVADGSTYERDNTNLPTPFEVSSVGVTLTQELETINEEVVAVLNVEVNSASEANTTEDFEVDFKATGSSKWKFVGKSSNKDFRIPFLQDGSYDIRARAINIFGIKGPYKVVAGYGFSPFAAPPEDVQNFSGNVVADNLFLTWDPVSDLDLSHYKIRYSSKTSGATYQDSVDLVKKVARPSVGVTVPARSGTYFCKAVDKVRNLSENPASFVVDIDLQSVLNLNVVDTLTEDPSFTGTKTNTTITDGRLTLDTDGSGDVYTEGVYEFSDYIDLGDVYTSRVEISLETVLLDFINLFDSATGLFDDRAGDFDGDPSAIDFTSVSTEVSTTNDDPSGSPTWSDWREFVVSDLTARAFRFRVKLSTESINYAPAIESLSVTVDMPDRIESQDDITFTGSTTVTFPTAFKATPSIGIAATLADGDRYSISSKTETGFTITTLTGGSTSTNSMTFDYVARGYGKKVT